MKKQCLLWLMTAIILTSCAPRVVTDMFTTEYPATMPDSVRVFLGKDEMPDTAQAIGEVKVVDNGLSIGGSYSRVLGLAIQATAQHGGNALVINEHRTPDLRSSIHRLWGTMLRMQEMASDTLIAHSVQRALARSEYDEYLSYKEQKSNFEQWREQIPSNIVRLSVGPSWLTSKYQLGNRVYSSKCGVDVELDYEHVWKSGFGIGINYLHNYTSFDEGVDMRLNYIGPSLVLALPFEKWRWDMALGFGYSSYSESYERFSYSEGHVAPFLRMGADYKIGEHLALGLQVNLISVKLDEPEGIELEKDEFYGVQRIGLQAGLRYYF